MFRSMLRLHAFVTILLIFAATVLAQRGAPRPTSLPVQVHGQVRLANGGAPAENILIRLENFRGGVVGEERTDRLGKFRFSGLTPAQYIIIVHAPGYQDVQQQVDLQTAMTDYVFLQLVPDKSAATEPATTAGVVDAKVPIEAQKEFAKGRTALLDDKEIEVGLRHLEKAIQIYPNFLEAQLLLGTAYMDAHRWEEAERALRRALEINPKAGTAALFALGEVYRHQKKYAEAEKALQEGLKVNERSSQGHFTLGRIYWEKGEIAKAGPEVGRALQLKPDLAEAHLLAGNILLRARQPENALAEFEEYLRLAPEGEFAKQARELVQKLKKALAEKK